MVKKRLRKTLFDIKNAITGLKILKLEIINVYLHANIAKLKLK